MRKTIASYVESFRERGRETWLAHTRGLRSNRWSYERVARTAYQFARELEARGVAQSEPGFALRVEQQVEAKLLLSDSSNQHSSILNLPVIRFEELSSLVSKHP